MAKEEVLHLMWVLVWVQIISGMPAEYFQLGVYESKTVCEQVRQNAEMMVTHNGIVVACLGVEL
jgi:hypothetical protein